MQFQSFVLVYFVGLYTVTHSSLSGAPHYGYQIVTFEDDLPQRSAEVQKKVLACYYNVPTMYDRPFAVYPEQIDPFLCTHIIVAFARIDNSTLLPGHERDIEYYNRTIKLKQKNAKLKVLISVGGASSRSDGFAIMMSTNATRMRFISSAIFFMDLYGFDGLDVDWEFPAAGSRSTLGVTRKENQKKEFSAFLKEFRRHVEYFGRSEKLILTAAVGALKRTIDSSYDIPGIGESLDFVNLMTYDFHYYDPVVPLTGPNSPLRNLSTEFGYLATMNAAWAATYWHRNGMPSNKIVLGVPTYGRTFSLADERYNGYYSLAVGTSESVGATGYISYPEACQFRLRNGTTFIFDSETREPYAFNAKDWITIANEQSTAEKAQFVTDMGFLGISIYNVNSDDAWGKYNNQSKVFPLIHAARDVLKISF